MIDRALNRRPQIAELRWSKPFPANPAREGGSLRALARTLDTNPGVASGEFMRGCLTRTPAEAPANVRGDRVRV